MPIVPAPAKVLVSGANGFMAMHIVGRLLEAGHNVRGTVRSAPKGEYVKKLYAKYGDKFEYVVVDNMMKEGAFDEALKDVDAVLHTAAPVSTGKNADDYIKPSVEGMNVMLNSILRAGPKVRRVVITSSAVTLLEPHAPPYKYTENDWNEYAVREVKEKGDAAASYLWYFAAKVLSERVAWDYVEKHKSEISWDLVALQPPYVFGPILHETKDPTEGYLYRNLQTEKPNEQLVKGAGDWVDVRDIAHAHVLSLQKEKAGGERLIISAAPFVWQDVYDALQTVPNIPRGNPTAQRVPISICDSSKAASILGIEYIDLKKSVTDTVLSVRERLGQK